MKIDVKLEAFEGPLDLLLHLIEKNKVNIYDIPIVEITNQYMEYIQEMERSTSMESMSEFLVMAATLLKIKSRMLLPKEEKEEEEDPREELVQRLVEYKMCRYAAGELKDMSVDAEKVFYKPETIPKEIREYEEPIRPLEIVGDVTLEKLNQVFQMVMRRKKTGKTRCVAGSARSRRRSIRWRTGCGTSAGRFRDFAALISAPSLISSPPRKWSSLHFLRCWSS